MRALVFEMSGKCNALYGSTENVPLQLINRSVDHEELLALYEVADVCLITSIRDGMNLVSYEYLAAQEENHGVLIISEFAGAAHSLAGARKVNPWDAEELANTLYSALNVDSESKNTEFQQQLGYIKRHTAKSWGSQFFQSLWSINAEVVNDGAVYLFSSIADWIQGKKMLKGIDKTICCVEEKQKCPDDPSTEFILLPRDDSTTSEWTAAWVEKWGTLNKRIPRSQLSFMVPDIVEITLPPEDIELLELALREIKLDLADILSQYGLKFQSSKNKISIFPAVNKTIADRLQSALRDIGADKKKTSVLAVQSQSSSSETLIGQILRETVTEIGYQVKSISLAS